MGRTLKRPYSEIRLSEATKDYHALAKRLADSEKPLPEIYLCCGTEDDLLEANRAYARELKDLGYPVSYEEGPARTRTGNFGIPISKK